MAQKRIQFLNDDQFHEETYLWRYMSLHKFLSFIYDQSLYLTRLDQFEDTNEGISPHHVLFNSASKFPVNNGTGVKTSVDPFLPVKTGFNNELRRNQRLNYTNCWVIGRNSRESVAMWNLYSEPNSIAIKIKYSHFKTLIQEDGFVASNLDVDFFAGAVDYHDFQDAFSLLNLTNKIWEFQFIKDISFQHEQEFRIIAKEPYELETEIIPQPDGTNNQLIRWSTDEEIERIIQKQKYDSPGISIKLNKFEQYPFEIVHHPKSKTWAKRNIVKAMENAGLDFQVSDSQINLK